MRFAFALFRYYPFGGLQGDTLRIALEAIRRGHEVTLFTTDWSGEAVPNLTAKLTQLKYNVQEGIRVKFRPSEADLASAKEFGKNFAALLK